MNFYLQKTSALFGWHAAIFVFDIVFIGCTVVNAAHGSEARSTGSCFTFCAVWRFFGANIAVACY